MIVKRRQPWWKVWRFLLSPAAVFLAPAFLLYTAFFVLPALQAFCVSMTEWSGFSPRISFIGIANFRELMYEDAYLTAIVNNFIFMICGGVATFFFSLLFAAALSNRRFFMRKFFKTVLFAPYVVSVVGVAILWTFIYDPSWGLLNSILTFFRNGAFAGAAPLASALTDALGALPGVSDASLEHARLASASAFLPIETVGIVWLGSRFTSIMSMIIVMIWGGIGFYVVLIMAGIDRIPEDLYEASRMDGATETQNFFHITLPLLRDVMVVAISIYMIGSLKTFGLIWAMTRGANSTQVMETYMYTVAFDPQTMSFRMGYGTAMTVVLFALVVFMTFTFNKIVRRSEVEY